jgi:uncharacterized membrane protein YphA (DoxX/SURF4 family)
MAEQQSARGDHEEMTRILSNEYNLVTARVFLGVFLLFVSIDKIADPTSFARSIADYRIVAGTAVLVLATVLPWMELLCGLALAFGTVIRGSALLSGTLFSIFTLAVFSALVRGLDISCGCFTQDPSAARLGWLKMGENAVLIILSAYVFFARHHRFSLDEYIQRRPLPSSPPAS